MKRRTDRRWSPEEIRQNQKEHYAGMAEHPPDDESQCRLSSSGISGEQHDQNTGAAVGTYHSRGISCEKI